MKPNLVVTVVGGMHSGKSKLAKTIVAGLRKSKLYGTQLEDGGIKTEADPGDIQVLVQTMEHDDVMHAVGRFEGPPSLHVTEGLLKAAFLAWELERRNGQCRSEVDHLPAGQVAQEAACKLWELLNTK